MKRRRLGKVMGRSSGYFTLKCFLEEEHEQANRTVYTYIQWVTGGFWTMTLRFPDAGVIPHTLGVSHLYLGNRRIAGT